MKILIVAACALVLGFVLGVAFSAAYISRLRRRVRELRAELEGQGLQKPETMKRVVWACVVNGFAWVWCSYILAWLDKPQIAEELPKVALAEIIAPVIVYALKSVVENLSKITAGRTGAAGRRTTHKRTRSRRRTELLGKEGAMLNGSTNEEKSGTT